MCVCVCVCVHDANLRRESHLKSASPLAIRPVKNHSTTRLGYLRWYAPRFSASRSQVYQGCCYARVSRRGNLSRVFLSVRPLAKFLVKDGAGFLRCEMSNLSITTTHSWLRSDSRVNSTSSCCVDISNFVAWVSTSLWSVFTFCHRAIWEIGQVFTDFRYATIKPDSLCNHIYVDAGNCVTLLDLKFILKLHADNFAD